MGRDKGLRPKNYKPSVILNLRQENEGGGLLNSLVETIEIRHAVTKKEIVILVHGYNNHRGDAEFA